jgi:adenine phosphoribosyltransferase
LIPVRKPGKLPADTISYKYDLEYGSDTLEMHKGIVMPQSRVLVIDDVLATGGTAEACVKLLESAQAVVVGCSFLVELKDLGGRERLGDHRIETVLTY